MVIKSLTDRIKNDLKESQITWKVALAFIPIAFFTYLFHESGHWIIGEILGNDMTLSLNNSTPRNGSFIEDTQALYSSIGGPAFTILQAAIFLFITYKLQSIYAYSFVYFAAFSRFFAIVFGGISRQDEGRIAALLNIHPFGIAIAVLLILLVILWRGSRLMKLPVKAAGYFMTLSTLAILLVIGIS